MALVSRRGDGIAGEVQVPGDKSISHRAWMIAAQTVGETRITGLLEGADVMASASALRGLGADVARQPDGVWRVLGRGVGGLAEAESVLDLGNSGTGARLLMGLLASQPFASFLSGDESLRRRPMERVMAPLRPMGAVFTARTGGRLPIAVVGAQDPVPVSYEMPVASAQVKSAVLLAGLNAPGVTSVFESRPTRDHTETLLRHFGAEVWSDAAPDRAGCWISVRGQPELNPAPLAVPSDFSSAAFPLVAALITPGSELGLSGVGVNPLRTGLLETLCEMGADISLENRRVDAGEPVADLRACAAPLRGVDVPAARVAAMIDEFPVFAVAAACAEGTSRMRDVGELRVKESDRLQAIAEGLRACGVEVEMSDDALAIHGSARPPAGGATVKARLDHRIAMAFLVLGCASDAPVAIDDADPIRTSFPGFVDLMNGIGARISEAPA
ncbi:MAG: 3-phosphoshikimate 1-carboxyvinyltransferase [Rhodospirillales bacterium]|nr:3-phosphoshikimate 1-carboxyvinyltransferase [Rhodospirillales bacterium]